MCSYYDKNIQYKISQWLGFKFQREYKSMEYRRPITVAASYFTHRIFLKENKGLSKKKDFPQDWII